MQYLRVFIGVFLFACGFFGLAALISQPLVHPIASTPPSVNAERLKEHVKKLSSDLYPRSFDFPDNLDLAGH
jgi:hypothetical protein